MCGVRGIVLDTGRGMQWSEFEQLWAVWHRCQVIEEYIVYCVPIASALRVAVKMNHRVHAIACTEHVGLHVAECKYVYSVLRVHAESTQL